MLKTIAICCAAATGFLTLGAVAAGLDLDTVAGRYVEHFRNGDVSGATFWSDNVLEIVKVTPKAAFFRTGLVFFNGHECALSGVADVSGAGLVYRDAEQQCELHLDVAGGKITFDDKDYHCRENSCGARGGYNGVSFGLHDRRPIRDLRKLLASTEYREALTAYQTRHQQ